MEFCTDTGGVSYEVGGIFGGFLQGDTVIHPLGFLSSIRCGRVEAWESGNKQKAGIGAVYLNDCGDLSQFAVRQKREKRKREMEVCNQFLSGSGVLELHKVIGLARTGHRHAGPKQWQRSIG